MTGRSFSSSGSSPGHVLNKLATNARLSFALPATSEVGVKNLRQPIESALTRTCVFESQWASFCACWPPSAHLLGTRVKVSFLQRST